jgi:hypothetical protein
MNLVLKWLALGVLLPHLGFAFTINFDTDPSGNPVPDGTIVNTLYSAQGVTFMREAPPMAGCVMDGTNVFASSMAPSGQSIVSKPNWVSPCSSVAVDFDETGIGVIRADLDQATDRVCIHVAPDDASQTGVLRVYDGSDMLLDTATTSGGAPQRLCITASGIRRVRFAGLGSTFAKFDDLTIGADEPRQASAPALSFTALAVLALLLLCAAAVDLRRAAHPRA